MTPLFLDNDAISKLASCDLLDDALASLDSTRASVQILSSFKHRFGITNEKRRARIEQEIGKQTFHRILEFQQNVGEIPAARNELLLMFEDLSAIDAGEAQLFATASELSSVIVVTGDKRSIRCLASSEACKPIAQSLEHRLLCLEQVVKQIITVRGFDYTKRKIVPAVDCDTALRAIFGMGLDAEEDNVMRALGSYIHDLQVSSGNLLR
jgi:hypothetical protein